MVSLQWLRRLKDHTDGGKPVAGIFRDASNTAILVGATC